MRRKSVLLLIPEIDPRLVEEVVILGVEGHPAQTRFRFRRNRLYEIEDPEKREEAFQRLHLRWFRLLEYDAPILRALEERPRVSREVHRIVVAPAASRREEGADLFVSPPVEGLPVTRRRSVGIQVLPETVLDNGRFLQLLRQELLHIGDMVDPAFGYRPALPPSAQGPVHDNLIRDRYRVLWDTTIDGRLTEEGHLPPDTRERRQREFCAAFPMLGPAGESTFDRFFRSSNPTHQQLVRFATHPGPGEEKHPTGSCPLCRFPTRFLETRPGFLPSIVVERIREDFPAWTPEDGLCSQCAELYRSRWLSDAAKKMLPQPC